MSWYLWIPIGFGIFNAILILALFVGHVMMTSKMYTMVCKLHETAATQEEGTEK